MVHHLTPESATNPVPEGEPASGDDDLEVEPVATLPGETSRTDSPSPAARVERLRRFALEVRVAGLEAELDRARRRHDAVVDQYERVIAERDEESTARSPVFSWLSRG